MFKDPSSPSAASEQRTPIDFELLFCSDVLKLPALHWGLWAPGEDLTLVGLRRAQQRFTERVLAHVPENARQVLDVGCGQGDASELLAKRGHCVTAISPVSNYVERFAQLSERGVHFELAKFEEYQSSRSFDLILMNESCGHFAPRVTFDRSASLLKRHGSLVIANMFRRDPVNQPLGKHLLSEFLIEARRFGFRVVEEEDITDEVVPTLELYQRWWRDHVLALPTFLNTWLSSQPPVKRTTYRVVRRVAAALARDLNVTMRRYAKQLDPEGFARHSTYRIFVFRQDDAQ
jgi:SAM-dependent methyltransferase